jgi:hypothetical protein
MKSKQTALFAIASLLAIGLTFAIGESLGLSRTRSGGIELANSICTAVSPGTSNTGKPVTPGDGWKSLANWRKLANDMSISDVQKILGEPERVDGGTIAFWHYPNGGTVTFFIGKVDSWSEPRPPAYPLASLSLRKS